MWGLRRIRWFFCVSISVLCLGLVWTISAQYDTGSDRTWIATGIDTQTWKNLDPFESITTWEIENIYIPQDTAIIQTGISDIITINEIDKEWDRWREDKCEILPTILQPYDIVFEPFCGEDVFSSNILKPWLIVQWQSEYFSFNEGSKPGLFLVVYDPCGIILWHTDILISDLDDKNTHNKYIAPALTANSIFIDQQEIIYNLSGTSPTRDISVMSYIKAQASTPLQMMQRTQLSVKWEWLWRYGIQPDYTLLIPQYQQVDNYEGTITRTLMY